MIKRKVVRQHQRKKHLAELLEKQYGVTDLPDGAFVNAKGRWRFATSAAAEVSELIKGVRSVGIALTGQENAVLTIEGAQILGNAMSKNVIELDDEQALRWMQGAKIELGYRHPSRFVVVRHGVDWLGGGIASGTKIIPELPSWRRLKESPTEHTEESG